MVLVVPKTLELLITFLAGVRAFIRVESHVDLEVPSLTEGLLAARFIAEISSAHLQVLLFEMDLRSVRS